MVRRGGHWLENRSAGLPIHQGWKKNTEYGKKNQVLEIVGAKGGTRTPTGVTPQDPESCASTKFRHFRTEGESTPILTRAWNMSS